MGGCDLLQNLTLSDIQKNINTVKPLTNEEVISGTERSA
jgi:hypothetical protein